MNVGYFSINYASGEGTVYWDKLEGQPEIEKGKFFRHIRFDRPLLVRMDGKKGMAVISMSKPA